jgi:DNA-binding MarR family transcriptional regulator
MRMVATLEKLGYVEPVADTTDRRACLIDLTDAGRGMLQDLGVSERLVSAHSHREVNHCRRCSAVQAALPYWRH